jgi:hypothetical protein
MGECYLHSTATIKALVEFVLIYVQWFTGQNEEIRVSVFIFGRAFPLFQGIFNPFNRPMVFKRLEVNL